VFSVYVLRVSGYQVGSHCYCFGWASSNDICDGSDFTFLKKGLGLAFALRFKGRVRADANYSSPPGKIYFQRPLIPYDWGLKHATRGPHVAREGLLCGLRCFLGILK